MCNKEDRMEKEEKTWSTWEELLLAFAVKRHGLNDWESVSLELQNRITTSLFTPQICKDKYHNLRRRFFHDEKINGHDEVDEQDDVSIPWIEELRQLRVAELKQEVLRYDLSIQSLQMKVKKMEEEREQSLKEETEKPDLRSQNDKNSGSDAKPEDFTGKLVSSEDSDRSFNESNSTENKRTGVKNEPEPVQEVKPGEEEVIISINKPVSEEDSCNDSTSSDKHEEEEGEGEKKRVESRDDSGNLLRGEDDSVSQSKEVGTKENSDVQSTASLSKRKKRRSSGGGGDAVETDSPAIGIIIKTAKSEPLIEFLDIIKSHKRGSTFKRRLDSQKTDKYKSMIRQHMDLEMVQARIDDGSYCSCPAKLYLDLLLIFNNAMVYFPKSSPESTAANELRGIVMEELKKNRTPSKDPSPGPEPRPGPLMIQPKPELERSDSLLAKHKSTAPIVVCRKRSSILAKAAASGSNNKPEKQADIKPPPNAKPPIKSSSNEEDSSIKLGIKEKPVTGVRSMRRSSKGRPTNASQSNTSQNTNTKQTTSSNVEKKEDAKPEKKKEDAKKRGAAADFLKRIKKNSPTKGTLMEALKSSTEEVVVKGNKREPQKKKVDERKETPVRRGGGGGGSKEEGSPSKRGRPPKRGGRETAQEKRVRENSEKQDDSSKRPKKRSRR